MASSNKDNTPKHLGTLIDMDESTKKASYGVSLDYAAF